MTLTLAPLFSGFSGFSGDVQMDADASRGQQGEAAKNQPLAFPFYFCVCARALVYFSAAAEVEAGAGFGVGAGKKVESGH